MNVNQEAITLQICMTVHLQEGEGWRWLQGVATFKANNWVHAQIGCEFPSFFTNDEDVQIRYGSEIEGDSDSRWRVEVALPPKSKEWPYLKAKSDLQVPKARGSFQKSRKRLTKRHFPIKCQEDFNVIGFILLHHETKKPYYQTYA